jgi:hypothetical protein
MFLLTLETKAQDWFTVFVEKLCNLFMLYVHIVHLLRSKFTDTCALPYVVGVEHLPNDHGRGDSRGQSTERFPGKIPR